MLGEYWVTGGTTRRGDVRVSPRVMATVQQRLRIDLHYLFVLLQLLLNAVHIGQIVAVAVRYIKAVCRPVHHVKPFEVVNCDFLLCFQLPFFSNDFCGRIWGWQLSGCLANFQLELLALSGDLFLWVVLFLICWKWLWWSHSKHKRSSCLSVVVVVVFFF
jgi:hypothetical protein